MLLQNLSNLSVSPEIFERNSFEQLCINLTNEKLQQHFNACTFRLEEELYIHEGICFKPVPYVDNQPILALLESKPNGILSVLDEVLKYPSATDKLLIDELHKRHEKTPHYQKAVKAPNSFIIKHYAGDVEYECFGFLDKNRDTLSEDLIHLVNNSRFQFIRVIIGKSFDDSKSRKTSLGFQFSQQLSDLMKTLNQTQAHYIRCIKPNVDKEPSQFNSSMVMEQLTNSGVFEAVEIRKSGFPFRYSYEKFISRYKPIDPFLKIKSHKEACMELLEKMEVQKHCVQFGATLLLYQAEVHRSIELKRNLAIDKLIRKVQRLTRGWLVRKAVKEYRDIQRLLTLSIEKRNLPELEYLLSTLTNLRYDFKELYQAKQLRVHLQKEIELNTYCERLLSTKDAFECFEEYSKALVAIDEFNLKGDFARDIKKRFNEAKEKYQCIRKLEEGISLMDEKKLESGLIEALALDLVANDAYISALAKLEHIRMEKPLLERLESECQKGGYYDENSQIDSSSLGEAISEYRRFELKTERGLLILRRAEALFDLRKALEKSLDQKDQESWKIVERLVQEHQQILRDDLEFKAAAKQLSHIIAIGELIERLTKSLDPIQYDELKLCLDQVDALALSENEFPVIEEARLLLARAEECQKKAEVAISRPDESLLDEVLFMFEELRFRDPLFEEVKELRDRIYEVKLNAENALKLMVPEQLKAVIDTAGKIKYVNSDVEKIIELLYHTTEEKFVQLQLKAAIALKDEVRITRSTIRLRDIFFSRLGDMFVFKKYPKLLSPAEFANSKGFGFKFNREKIAASFYLHTIQPIHVALTRDLFGQDATDAKTIFKTILCFMGDRENSSDSATLAFSLINKGMNQVNLRAEIYCQLIKQLTNNPTSKSEEKGWQLLSACLDAFPPGSDFENYLEMWIRTNAGSRKDHLLVTFHRSVYFGAKTFPISVNDVIQMLQGHSIRRESSLKGIDLTTNEESLSLQVIKSQGPPPLPISTRLNHTSSPGNMLQYSKSQQAPKPEIPVRPPVLPPRNISKPTSKIISRSPRSPRSPRFNARSGVPSPIRIPQRNKTLQANSRSNLRVPTNPNFNNSLSGSSSFVRNFPAKKRPSFVNPGHLYSESLTSDFQLTINSFIDTKSSVGLDMIWQAAVDPNSGRTYYFNIITREVAWNRPDGYHEPY